MFLVSLLLRSGLAGGAWALSTRAAALRGLSHELTPGYRRTDSDLLDIAGGLRIMPCGVAAFRVHGASPTSRAAAARAACAAFPQYAVAICFTGTDPSHARAERWKVVSSGVVVTAMYKGSDADCSCLARNMRTHSPSLDAVITIPSGSRLLGPLWPYCFYNWQRPNITFAHHHGAHEVQSPGACTDESSLRLALGLGGLARTLSSPLVYRTIRGHLVDAIGGQTTVFAAIRLEDARVAGYGGATATASGARVRRALEVLGAESRNVLIEVNATVASPNCSYITHPARPPMKPCRSYYDLCALPGISGQLYSRRRIYEMIVAHESRNRMLFSHVLFMRPDLALIVPVPHYCTLRAVYSLDRSFVHQDYIMWMPRVDMGAVLSTPDIEFRECRARFQAKLADDPLTSTVPESFFVHVIRRAGSNISQLNRGFVDQIQSDEYVTKPFQWLKVATIARALSSTAPHGFICSFVAEGLAYAERVAKMGSSVSAGHFRMLVYRGRAREAHMIAKKLPTCTAMLVANPSVDDEWNANPLTLSSTHRQDSPSAPCHDMMGG